MSFDCVLQQIYVFGKWVFNLCQKGNLTTDMSVIHNGLCQQGHPTDCMRKKSYLLFSLRSYVCYFFAGTGHMLTVCTYFVFHKAHMAKCTFLE